MTNLLRLWQTIPCHINEIAFSIGNFQVRWYSISYLLAILTIGILLWWRIKKNELPSNLNKSKEKFSQDLLDIGIFVFIGAILGGRLGYAFFYDQSLLLNPINLFNPFQNGSFTGIYGMSFHGGLIGAALAGFVTIKFKKYKFIPIANFFTPAFPLGYFWGRIGNFLNHELIGKNTGSFLGMNFSENCQGSILNHPSQLYEAIGEGLIIFLILWPIRNHPKFKKHLFAIFLILYGIIRFNIEFFRQPEITFGWLTMGQILCFAMVIVGIFLIIFSFKIKEN